MLCVLELQGQRQDRDFYTEIASGDGGSFDPQASCSPQLYSRGVHGTWGEWS